MPESFFSRRQVRPAPYYTLPCSYAERRLPGHHLCGLRHDTAVNFVARHKKRFPCFLTGDVRLFFASVRHEDVLTYMQVAYRDLCRLDYVPRRFKERFVGGVSSWLNDLPAHRGLPVGSALSGILGPVLLLPLWLSLRRLHDVPLLVYMDDFMICAEDEARCAEIHAWVDRCLSELYDLELNRAKSRSGRFATGTATFCGWEFAGGYARIAAAKSEAIRERIREVCRRTRKADAATFIKRINRKIDGFGHYYKFGQVRAEYRALDRFVRGEVRRWYARTYGERPYRVEALQAAGLRSLESILPAPDAGGGTARSPRPKLRPVPRVPELSAPRGRAADLDLSPVLTLLEKLHRQNTQLLRLRRREIALLEQLLNL